MEISDVFATATGSGNDQVRSDASGKKLADDFSSFLTLLTTQLQHQDPTSPMDSSEFTNQLVQFSSVEQQIQTNTNLEGLSAQLAASANAGATSYLGKNAVLFSNAAHFDGADAEWTYSLPADATATALVIKNEAGQVVNEIPGNTEFGPHDFKWDGTNDAGDTVPEGTYTLDVVAFDTEGDELHAGIQIQDRVNGIHYSDGQPIFTVGEQQVYQSHIIQLLAED